MPEIKERLVTLLSQPAEDTSSLHPELEELALANPVAFEEAALNYLGGGGTGDREGLLIRLLHRIGLLFELLIDPDKTALEDAVSFARSSKRDAPMLDVELARVAREQQSSQQIDRILSILIEIAESDRILPLLAPLLRLNDPKLRSKAALVFTKFCPSCHFARSSLFDNDPRVRANVIEALWGRREAWATSALQAALNDLDNRVAANAALGLHKIGDPAGLKAMKGMAEDFDSRSRASAAWAMGEAMDRQCLPALRQLSQDTDEVVREHSIRAISKIEGLKQPRVGDPD